MPQSQLLRPDPRLSPPRYFTPNPLGRENSQAGTPPGSTLRGGTPPPRPPASAPVASATAARANRHRATHHGETAHQTVRDVSDQHEKVAGCVPGRSRGKRWGWEQERGGW